MAIADNASVSDYNALHASMTPWHDTFIVDEEYALKSSVSAVDDVVISEGNPVSVTLAAADRSVIDDQLRADVRLSALDSIAPFDDATAQLTQIFRYDGVLDYDGFADYGSTLAADNIFISDDDDRQRWTLLQAELERDFDEPCTCGASDYDWWYSSIRLGEERFLISDPQLVTVEIKCARCGYTLAEYIVPGADWEVMI